MLIMSIKTPVKVFLKVHGALFLGLVCSLALLQEDEWLKVRLERIIVQSMTEIIGVPFSCKISHVDMLGGSLTAVDMYAASAQGAWTFSCPETLIHFSWLSWLKDAAFDTRLIFNKALIFSRYENKQWAVVDPFLKVIRAPITWPMKLSNCSFTQGNVNLEWDTIRLHMSASSSTDVFHDVVSTKIVVQKSDVQRGPKVWAKNIAGTLMVDVPLENTDAYEIKMQVHADLPFVKKLSDRSLLIYTYKNGAGSWQWSPEDRSVVIKADGLTFNPDDSLSMDAQVTGSLEKIAHYMPFTVFPESMKGALQGQAHVHILDDAVSYQGTARIDNLSYEGICFGNTDVEIKGDKQKVAGTITGAHILGAVPSVQWLYDLQTGTCESTVHLGQAYCPVNKLAIEKEGARLNLVYKDGVLKGDYVMRARIDPSIGSKIQKPKKVLIQGTLEGGDQVRLKGTVDGAPFACTFKLKPYDVTYFSYGDPTPIKSVEVGQDLVKKKSWRRKGRQKKEHEVIPVKRRSIVFGKKNGVLVGEIDFEYIKDAFSHFFGFQPQGTARIDLKANIQKSPLSLDVSLSDGNIKIPEAHNYIKEVRATLSYDATLRCLTAKNVLLQLQKGTISTQRATLFFSDTGSLMYAHLPCRAHEAFVGWNKDFFGLLSGAVTGVYAVDKKGGHWKCTGVVSLDKGHMKSNVLSAKNQQDMLSSSFPFAKNIELDLHFSTKSPLQVKTLFFNTNTEISATVKGTVAQPLVRGLVELNKGSFLFPYKPLYVSLGKLYLNPEQPDDPVIQLAAKNTIKKYAITMQVTGTLRQPKISFKSSPALPEEQIITLLLSGSHDSPLYAAMPPVVMMHLESLFFGSDEHSSKAQQFFKALFKPFKNVRFVPTYGEEEGRTFREQFEIDFTDRLRAKAQNNLTLSKETQFEVEYSVSDDVTVKAIRDDTGSLGGEVEMRWKF